MESDQRRHTRWLAPMLSVLLAWAFWAFSFWRLLGASAALGIHPVRAELRAAVARDPALKLDVALFVGAQLLIHAVLGLFAWLLALATQRAYPQRRFGIVALVIGWSFALMLFVYVLNSAVFPWSASARWHEIVTAPVIATVNVADVLTVCMGAAILFILGQAALTYAAIRAQVRRIVAYALVGIAILATVRALDLRPTDAPVHDKPHVIIIGIDSLRPDAVAQGRGMGLTPNIDEFLKGATTFTDTTTPLARTFPSWMTILSGQHPMRSGARDNLMAPEVLNDAPRLAHRLRSLGYSTIYATDEVRFSNIDQTFGFDHVLGPKMGASDFMLASWVDSPWSNLLVNTRVARFLFPNSYANRAAAGTYRPETFVRWIDRELDVGRPAFLATHLTLPHWPYHWAEDNSAFFGRVTEHPYTYLAAVVGADRQFGQLMQVLEHRGVLENAIVVLLSDHGEALGMSADNLLYSKEAKAAVGKLLVAMDGHGSSVLSPTQYQVLFAIRRYGAKRGAEAMNAARSLNVPASLEDVTPTILDLAGARFDHDEFDGLSLAPALRAPASSSELRTRIRFTETGLTTTFMRMGDFDEAANLREGMKFFAVNPANSRVVFRRDRLSDLIRQKERAAFTDAWLLAAVPDPQARSTKYVLVSRAGGVPLVVTYEPDTVSDPNFVMLWNALRARFGAELSVWGE